MKPMEDLIVSVPKSDVAFVAALMERMGFYIKNRKYQGERSRSFRQLFDRTSAVSTHEWSLEEINAEINAVRQHA